MTIAKVLSEGKVPVKIWAKEMEEEAEAQLKKLATLPFLHSHVAVMPDAHHGKGSTVGTVIATRGAIIPAAVGVDIGCGMAAVKLPIKVSDLADLPGLRSAIEKAVPVGRAGHQNALERARLYMLVLDQPRAFAVTMDTAKQLGTLGGGNHFVEVCVSAEDEVWIVLHSGSRNVGKRLADVHINNAKGLMKQYFIELPDPDLAYLAQGTEAFGNYIHDLHWAQKYASMNRALMIDSVMAVVRCHVGVDESWDQLPVINCHHNYTQLENHFGANVWVTRKGAVSARAGELGIIPGSMGTSSFIVEGLGNDQSFHSCSHGAGRKMSRTKARATFTTADLVLQTAGVECKKDDSVLDEIPGAYKDIDEVMRLQSDLVRPLHHLKQVLCVKG